MVQSLENHATVAVSDSVLIVMGDFMKRSALYSSSAKANAKVNSAPTNLPVPVEVTPSRWRFSALQKKLLANQLMLLWVAVGLLALMLATSLAYRTQGERKLTQEDINAAVLKTLETRKCRRLRPRPTTPLVHQWFG